MCDGCLWALYVRRGFSYSQPRIGFPQKRTLHPEEVTYSWWSYRFHAREKNAGWRIDYFIVSRRLLPRVTDAAIRTEVYGSDHCPVVLQLDTSSGQA